MNEIDDLSELLGKPGESVPVVDAADLKVMWAYCQKLKAERRSIQNVQKAGSLLV